MIEVGLPSFGSIRMFCMQKLSLRWKQPNDSGWKYNGWRNV